MEYILHLIQNVEFQAAFAAIDQAAQKEEPEIARRVLAGLFEADRLQSPESQEFVRNFFQWINQFNWSDGPLNLDGTQAKAEGKYHQAWEITDNATVHVEHQIPVQLEFFTLDGVTETAPLWSYTLETLHLHLSPRDWQFQWVHLFQYKFSNLKHLSIRYGQLGDTLIHQALDLLPQLKTLSIAKGRLSADVLAGLFSHSGFTPRHLALEEQWELHEENGFEKLFSTPHTWWRELRQLSLAGSHIAKGWDTLSQLEMPHLKSLNLSDNDLDPESIRQWLSDPPPLVVSTRVPGRVAHPSGSSDHRMDTRSPPRDPIPQPHRRKRRSRNHPEISGYAPHFGRLDELWLG